MLRQPPSDNLFARQAYVTHQAPPLPTNTPVWDDGGWTPLPRLEGQAEADVCVVGLGGSGLSCVLELLRLGQSVVGVDAGHVAGGAAGRNGGFLLAGCYHFHHRAVRAYGHERALAIYRLTLDEIDRMAADLPGAVKRMGSLRIAASDEEMDDCRAQLRAMRADGLPVMPYDGPEGRGLLFPADGVFQPMKRCRTLARRALERGARLYELSRAVEVTGSAVRTEHGMVRARRVAVAVDGCLETVVPALEGRVRSARLQMVATAPLLGIRWPRPVYMRWGYEWWQQLSDGRVALGGFRDRAGDGEWTRDAVPGDPVQSLIERFLREELKVDAPITHRWAATVGYTPDGLPIFEEVEPGLWVTGGYSGTGNVIGTLLGRAAAQMAVTGRSEIAAPFVGG